MSLTIEQCNNVKDMHAFGIAQCTLEEVLGIVLLSFVAAL
jgi:hypothetical protein